MENIILKRRNQLVYIILFLKLFILHDKIKQTNIVHENVQEFIKFYSL